MKQKFPQYLPTIEFLQFLDASYWKELGQQLLRDEVRRQRYERIDTAAKNIIFFLGDGNNLLITTEESIEIHVPVWHSGMSIATVTAARIYKGQKVEGVTGEEDSLTFETFPYAALSKVKLHF